MSPNVAALELPHLPLGNSSHSVETTWKNLVATHIQWYFIKRQLSASTSTVHGESVRQCYM